MLKINHITFFSILLFLPLTYIVGIAITEIFFFLLIIWFLFQKKKKQIFLDKKFLFVLSFSLYVALVALLKIEHQDLLYSSIFYFRFALLTIIVAYVYEKFYYLRNNNILRNIVFLCFLTIIFDSFFQFFTGYNLLGFKIHPFRVSSFFGKELILGGFMLKLLPLVIWYLIYSDFDFKKNSLFATLFFSLFICVIYISGERTAIGLMLMLVFIIPFFIKNLRKIFVSSFSTLIIFVLITSFLDIGKSNIANRVFLKTFNDFTNNINSTIKNKESDKIENNNLILSKKKNFKIFSKDHHGHYVLALDLFKKNYTLGVGPKGFRSYCRKIDYDSKIGICSTHPHNTLIQILAELGIIGLFFYLFTFLFILKSIINLQDIKNIKLNDKYCIIIASLSIFVNLFPFLPSGNFFNNWISIINFYSLGLFFYSYNKIYKY